MKRLFFPLLIIFGSIVLNLSAAEKTVSEFVSKLNEALKAECTAYTQYGHDASKTLDKELASELTRNAQDELEHAKKLTTLITARGGKPRIDIQKIDTPEIKNMLLNQKPATEESAVADYKELVSIAQKLNDSEAQKVLAGILTQEEEHLGEEQTPMQLFDWD